jgi:hypothetical protein
MRLGDRRMSIFRDDRAATSAGDWRTTIGFAISAILP